MISLQKAMRLGIAPETEIESDKVQKSISEKTVVQKPFQIFLDYTGM